MTLRPTNPQEIQEAVRTHPTLLPRGGGTKSALSTSQEGQTVLEMTDLSGVLEYNPSEYVFVAQAGTPVADVEKLLAQHGQYLPFDPPFVEAGATLGGTVAAGLSGPLRQRYGGVRDFILGVKFVDGEGNLIKGGGKVVKNAAGFDTPKLMVGSLGRLGVLTEVAFKVFPFPKATTTLKVTFDSLQTALNTLTKLASSSFEFYALDLETNPPTLTLRIGGLSEALPPRLNRLLEFLGNPPEDHILLMEGDKERGYWQWVNRLEWGLGYLVKVPVQPKKIPALEAALGMGMRRYLSAGNLLYLVWLDKIATLDALLKSQELSGLVLKGNTEPVYQDTLQAAHSAGRYATNLESPLIGVNLGQAFGERVTTALDPSGRFSRKPEP
ncbi:MAG: 2-hydroxy-acid oxidase [Meiothermus sp.]